MSERERGYHWEKSNMKILFIYPAMGAKEDYRSKQKNKTTKSWAIEPLTISTMSGLTPKEWQRSFYDDRIEDINYDDYSIFNRIKY